MIREEEHDGVVPEIVFLQAGDNGSDLFVRLNDLLVVAGDGIANDGCVRVMGGHLDVRFGNPARHRVLGSCFAFKLAAGELDLAEERFALQLFQERNVAALEVAFPDSGALEFL